METFIRKCDGITKLEIELIHLDAPKVSFPLILRINYSWYPFATHVTFIWLFIS
jgi:hypothetical protein